MPSVDVNGLELFYSEHGEGEPLLLLHGWTCDGNDWLHQIPALEGSYRLIVPDQRGHGRSPAPEDAGYTISDFAGDIAAFLDAVGIRRTTIISHAFGTHGARVFAHEHPERVRAFVAVDGIAAGARGGGQVPRLETAMLPGFFARFATAATPPHLPAWHLRRAMGVPEYVFAPMVLDLLRDGEDAFGTLSEPMLTAMQCPFLAFAADPGAAQWVRERARHPYSKTVTFEGSGHWLHQERPAEFNAILTDWLGGLPD